MSDLRDRLARQLAGRYELGEELGQGGMALVFDAHDLRHDRPVAVKVMRPEITGSREPERFLREIRTLARLTHPHILPLHDSGEGDGLLYYVMPRVGESLRRCMDREKTLAVPVAVGIVREVAAALSFAHEQDILHRDIKPENILLQAGHALVADFGIARMISECCEITDRGVVVGTPAYMSPEQASGDTNLDGRSDIYSLACVLFEALAGEPPFSGPNAQAVMARHATAPPPPVRSLRPDVPEEVARALARALAKEPAQRFQSPGSFADALATTPGRHTMAAPGVHLRRRVAVLPFVNTGGDPDSEYFSDGMTDELITALAQVEGLEVVSRTSAFAFKGAREDVRAIAARLEAAAVVEGTVRRAGERLRVTVQLTDGITGQLQWSQRYDRTMGDLFDMQDTIVRSVVGALRAALAPDIGPAVAHRYTDNVEAYGHYLRGRFHWNLRTASALVEAIQCFESAIAADPSFALAYTGLADAYALQIDYRVVPVEEGLARARAMAEHALALDDSLAEAHTSLAWVKFIYDWDWEDAEREFRRAIDLNPRYATARQWAAWPLLVRGRPDEALAEAQMAAELDPASVSIRRSLGWLLYYLRRYEEALDHLRRALDMNPTSEETLRIMGLILLQLGRFDESETALRQAVALSPSPDYALATLGYLKGRTGEPERALEILESLETEARSRYVSPVGLTVLRLGLGDTDGAFAALEQAFGERRGWMAYLRVEPMFDPIRGDPRFGNLVGRMGLG